MGTLQLGSSCSLGCSCNGGAPANRDFCKQGVSRVAEPIPRDAVGLLCTPGSAGGGLGTRQVQTSPAASATRRWPLHHPSWGHDHHRNRCTSKGGKRQNRQGRKEGRVTRAVPVQLGQGSVPMCPRVSPQCQHGATGTYEALSTGTWDPSIRDLCVCQHSPRFVCFLPSVVQIFRFLKSARCFAEREGDCRSILGALKSL